jgi:FtsP/CotA-like multicopper oxidase with cupredoxin domain
LLGPGVRREVLVQGGPEGTYRLESLAFRQFTGKGNLVPTSTIATLESSGPEVDDTLPEAALATPEDLRGEKIDQRHRLVFTEKQVTDGFEFLINGKVFDPARVDEVMTLGEVNEWTLVNKTKEWHTFHIHVNDFQVVSVQAKRKPGVSSGPEGIEDVAPAAVDPSDVVAMPPGSTIKFLTRPTDFTGKFVFHCHMTFHEDHGMMGVVKVIAPSG